MSLSLRCVACAMIIELLIPIKPKHKESNKEFLYP